MYYIPIAGTGGYLDEWFTDDSVFTNTLRARNFIPIRGGDSRPFRWDGVINGLGDHQEAWKAGADSLFYFIRDLPYANMNLIAHSHGGQLALTLASQGVKIRSLITVGTPYRYDVPVDRAEKFIEYHQHIYDVKFDIIQWLGSLGDGKISNERRFLFPNVINYGLQNIKHSRILREEKYIKYWNEQPWLDGIINLGGLYDLKN